MDIIFRKKLEDLQRDIALKSMDLEDRSRRLTLKSTGAVFVINS